VIGQEKSRHRQVASRGMKTYSKSRIELRNLQMLKKKPLEKAVSLSCRI